MDRQDNEKYIRKVGELVKTYDIKSNELRGYLENCYMYDKAVDIEYLNKLVKTAIDEEVEKCLQSSDE
mgnify:CR=1 FL=1